MDVDMSDGEQHSPGHGHLAVGVLDGQISVDGEHMLENEILRSNLLKDLLHSDGLTYVPLSVQQFALWRGHLRSESCMAANADSAATQLSQSDAGDKLDLMEAAEFLSDDRTLTAAAAALADDLIHDGTNSHLLEGLNQNRTLRILRASGCTVTHLLLRLPPTLHELAIESCTDSAALAIHSEVLPVACRPPPGLSALTFLTSLSLPHTDAGACDSSLIASALKPLSALIHLNLHDCGLTSAAAVPLAGALSHLIALQHLDLSSNMLLRCGVEALLPALRVLAGITLLSLATNSIIAATSFFQELLQTLPQLKSLDLASNAALRPTLAADSSGSGEGLLQREQLLPCVPDVRGTLPPLQELLLSNACLENSDVEACVAPLLRRAAATMTRIDLSDNCLTSVAAEHLIGAMRHMPVLRVLDVRGCTFSYTDIRLILQALKEAHAASRRATESSDLLGTGAAGMSVPAEAMDGPPLQSLGIAEMEAHPMEDDDAAVALLLTIGKCTALKSLDVCGIDLPLHSTDIFPVHLLIALTALDISHNEVHSEFAGHMTALHALLSLKACAMLGDGIQESFLAALAALTALTELEVTDNALNDAALLADSLRALTALQHLNLGGNSLLLEAESPLPDALTVLVSLRVLILTANEVDAACAVALARALQALTGLTGLVLDYLCVRPEATLALGACLPALTGLSSLILSGNELPRDAPQRLADVLRRMTSLQELELAAMGLQRRGVDVVAKAIADLPRLSVVDLSANDFTSGGAEVIGNELQRLELLRDLDISGNSIGHMGLLALARSITGCQSLQAINLGDVGTRGIRGNRAWSALLGALSTLPGLRELDLQSNPFTAALVTGHIKPHVAKMTALQVLDVQDCGMTTETVVAWMDAVAPLTSLNALNIGGNNLPGDFGERAKRLLLLEDLSLKNSDLFDDHVATLAHSLVGLGALRVLTLSDNPLSETTLSYVADILPRVLLEFESVEDEAVVSLHDGEDDDDPGESDDGSDSDESSDSDSNGDAL